MSEDYAKPLPHPTTDTQPYWDGLQARQLRLQHCADCGKVRHYPRPVCDACWSMNVAWQDASNRCASRRNAHVIDRLLAAA